MMHNTNIYNQILSARKENRKLLAILLDPDKQDHDRLGECIENIHNQPVDLILVGGSEVRNGHTEALVHKVKQLSPLPVVLFPGDYSQITKEADALLFLNLLSGRNAEYLINQQVKAVPKIEDSNLEILPTAYILVDGGVSTSVQRVSQTEPLSLKDQEAIVNTAIAGMYMGHKLVYLEAGSGAHNPVPANLISLIRSKIDIPIIAGGGIRDHRQLASAFESGADMVVIGTAFEQNPSILRQILNNEHFH
jgi:putative glycerol-1-phosphate prenyltransferase